MDPDLSDAEVQELKSPHVLGWRYAAQSVHWGCVGYGSTPEAARMRLRQAVFEVSALMAARDAERLDAEADVQD